jgi:hypothetical protein
MQLLILRRESRGLRGLLCNLRPSVCNRSYPLLVHDQKWGQTNNVHHRPYKPLSPHTTPTNLKEIFVPSVLGGLVGDGTRDEPLLTKLN